MTDAEALCKVGSGIRSFPKSELKYDERSKVLDSIQAWDVRPLSQAYQISFLPLPDDHTTTRCLKQEASTRVMDSSPVHTHDDLVSTTAVVFLKGNLTFINLRAIVSQIPFIYDVTVKKMAKAASEVDFGTTMQL